MKNLIIIIVVNLTLFSCKNESKIEVSLIEDIKKEDITTSIYPESVTKVFDAHGGISTWNTVEFDQVILSEEASDLALFTKPDTSKIVE